MFAYCKNLKTLPNLKGWNMENVKDLSYMFYECQSLNNLSGINKLKVNRFLNYNEFISGCKSLSPKPDISSWKK